MASAVTELEEIAAQIYEQLSTGKIPEMSVPTRSKNNIIFDEKSKVWKYGNSETTRTAKKLDGAYMLLRTTYLLDIISEMSTQSKAWELGKFHAQDESNKLIEDLEIITHFQREDFKIRPEEDGAKVLGDVTLTEINRKGKPMKINCRNDVGDTGYNIPYNVEENKITFNSFGNSTCIIAIETGGMFDRLVENGFDEAHEAILVHIKGQPARSTRRFLQRMHQASGLPLLLFTDADPWSYRIYSSVAYGAIKTAHISHILATPSARYLGVTPSDIINYELPADELTDRDKSALKSILTDPRFNSKYWRNEIELQLEINRKSEQQALAKYGLDFVTNTYLPEKLKEMNIG